MILFGNKNKLKIGKSFKKTFKGSGNPELNRAMRADRRTAQV